MNMVEMDSNHLAGGTMNNAACNHFVMVSETKKFDIYWQFK